MAIIKSPSSEAQTKLVDHIRSLLTIHRNRHDLVNKMTAIDIAYSRFKELTNSNMQNEGIDSQAMQQFQDEFEQLRESFTDVDIPLIASQVDTAVAYASEIYLSGAPTFGVVSDPKNAKIASYIEALIDKHARISKYTQELQKFFRDTSKYNLGAIICEWDIIQHYQRTSEEDVVVNSKPSISSVDVGYNRVKRVDPYNLILDDSVLPGSVASEGDYAGEVELLTITQLKRRIAKLKKGSRGHIVNQVKALKEGAPTDKSYMAKPTISRYIQRSKSAFDWDEYLADTKTKREDVNYGKKFEVVTMFMRLETVDFDLKLDTANTEESRNGIFKVIMVNGNDILYIERMYTALEHLPILIGQPIEDGFGLQTLSVAEAAMPMQEAATGLVKIRFASARRAVTDRAIYDSNMIDPVEVNNPSASAKIPVKTNALVSQSLDSAYRSIPYTDSATGGLLSDALTVGDWTSDLNGFNRAAQGRFTKGNRTVGEFNDIQSNADQRQRLPVIVLENQVFAPLKQLIMLNILRYASGEVVQSATDGTDLQVDVNQLTSTALDFKVADGYQPKSKLANTDLLTALLTQIGTNQFLAQQYGPSLPAMFAHIASLGGIVGLEQYNPATGQGNSPGQSAPPSEGAPSEVTNTTATAPTP